ncbi:MAG: O-antigen ligase family protein [Gemmatimonadaceae bacterium]
MRAVAAATSFAPSAGAVRYPRGFVIVVAALVLVSLGRVHEVVRQLQPFRLGMLTVALAVLVAATTFKREMVTEFFATPVGKGLVVVVAFALLTIPTAEWPKASFMFVTKIYYNAVVLLFVVALAFADRVAMRVVITALVVDVGLAGLLSIVSGEAGRYEIGLTFDPNETASLFLMTIPWAIYLLLTEKGIARVAGLVSIPACLLGVLQTGSRGGLLGTAALVPFLIYLSPPKRRGPFIMLVVVGAIGTAGMMGDQAIFRLRKAFDTTEYNYTTEDGRIEIWKRGLKYIATAPVQGVGVDGFPYKELATKVDKGFGVRQAAAHNMYLQVAAELGLIGFSGFLAMLFGGLMLCSKARKRARQWIAEGGGPEADRELLRANMAQASLYSVMCTGFFLSMGYSAMVYFACGAAAGVWLGATRRSAGPGTPQPQRRSEQRLRGMRGWRSARPVPAVPGLHANERPLL